MAAARIAVDVMALSGARTRSRLAALVAHYSEVYGEDYEAQLADAIEIALRNVLEFDIEA